MTVLIMAEIRVDEREKKKREFKKICWTQRCVSAQRACFLSLYDVEIKHCCQYTTGVPAGVTLVRGVVHLCQRATATPHGKTHRYRHDMRRKKCLSYTARYVRNIETVSTKRIQRRETY